MTSKLTIDIEQIKTSFFIESVANLTKIEEFNENGEGIPYYFDPLLYSPSNESISALGVQMDGKILIGGSFHFYNRTLTSNVARLHYNNTPLGVEHMKNTTIKFYPNPTYDYVYFLERLYDLTIYNLSMQKVQTLHNTSSINLSKLPAGIYILKGKNTNEEHFTIKVVKNNP